MQTKNNIPAPTHAEIDLGRLIANYRAIAAHVQPARVMVAIKANAYGHGMVAVAQALAQIGAPCLAVSCLLEGVQLRRAGIETPILVLGGLVVEQVGHFLEYKLMMTVSSAETLLQIDADAKKRRTRARIHLKIDTGMGRMGVPLAQAEALLEASLSCNHCDVAGVYSHFANADAADLHHSRLQLQRFNDALTFYPRHSLPMPMRHIGNSAAILQLPQAHFDCVRAGILFYGVYPLAHPERGDLSSEVEAAESDPIPVQPAITWKTNVVHVKRVAADTPISYGSIWRSPSETTIVTLPVGYGDGYFRAMTGKAQVLIDGRRYPVVGRICMDQLMVDVGDDAVKVGDEVVLLGRADCGQGVSAHTTSRDPHAIITPDEMARWAGTIPYEIFTNISARVTRLYNH